MKFGRPFNVVRRLSNNDLNLTGVMCILNRACDEVVAAEEYLVRRSKSDDVESRAIYSITDSNIDHGYYVLVDDDAFVIGMGISNDDEPRHYHMGKESNFCETKIHVTQKELKRKIFEMFRVSESTELGKGIMKAFRLQSSPDSYVVQKKYTDVPAVIEVRNGQIIFAQ